MSDFKPIPGFAFPPDAVLDQIRQIGQQEKGKVDHKTAGHDKATRTTKREPAASVPVPEDEQEWRPQLEELKHYVANEQTRVVTSIALTLLDRLTALRRDIADVRRERNRAESSARDLRDEVARLTEENQRVFEKVDSLARYSKDKKWTALEAVVTELLLLGKARAADGHD